jgi:hypothetical protein
VKWRKLVFRVLGFKGCGKGNKKGVIFGHSFFYEKYILNIASSFAISEIKSFKD